MVEQGKRPCRRSRAWHRARWRDHVRDWLSSGLVGAEYCRRHGLSARSLYRWRGVFAASGELGKEPGEACAQGEPSRNARGSFAEVGVRGAMGWADEGRVEVVLAGNRRIRVEPGFDADTLGQVVRVLEGLGC
jgi:hypothetical protein